MGRAGAQSMYDTVIAQKELAFNNRGTNTFITISHGKVRQMPLRDRYKLSLWGTNVQR